MPIEYVRVRGYHQPLLTSRILPPGHGAFCEDKRAGPAFPHLRLWTCDDTGWRWAWQSQHWSQPLPPHPPHELSQQNVCPLRWDRPSCHPFPFCLMASGLVFLLSPPSSRHQTASPTRASRHSRIQLPCHIHDLLSFRHSRIQLLYPIDDLLPSRHSRIIQYIWPCCLLYMYCVSWRVCALCLLTEHRWL